jgi:Family of unknown function (DUF5906)
MTALDLAAIRMHVALLHHLAQPKDHWKAEGKLLVAAFGEDPNQPDPKTGKAGLELTPKVRHFDIGDVDGMAAAVVDLAGEQHRNVYAPLAVYRSDLPPGRKGGEKDIVGVLGLVADFDDADAGHWRDRLPLPPSYVIETSSGRFQTFYCLDRVAAFADAKPVAVRLKAFAGCDHGTQDLSHVWRIAGAPNWPTARKVAAGRPPAPQLPRVASSFDGTRVALGDLEKALPEASAPPVAELVAAMPAKLRAQIEGPIAGDRSKNLFAVISQLCRRNLDDATIERIIRAYPNGVGEKYVNRTDLGVEIIRARTKTSAGRAARGKPGKFDGETTPAQIAAERIRSQQRLEQLIADFNSRYAVVNEAGKVWVFHWRLDPVLQRQVLDRIAFGDFKKMYENKRLNVIFADDPNGAEAKSITRTLADWWLDLPQRREYLGGVTFDPTGRAPGSYWNLWRGFAVEPKAGDWSLMQEHIEKVICSGVRDHAHYVLDWLARLVQFPQRPGEVAIVLRGDKGVGKSVLGSWIARLFGQHGMQIFSPQQLVGRFNGHLRDCVFLFGDEAFFAGDRQHEGVLKGLITELFMVIEGKFQNPVTVANMLHVILASNSDWVIPASSSGERRFAVFDVLDTRRGDFAYFAALVAQMENGGLAAMLHDLLRRDIGRFEVRNVPQTEALRVQKTLSLGSVERWWLAVLSRGYLWKSRHGVPWFTAWHPFYTTELLCQSYEQWCGEHRPFDRKNREQLGKALAQLYSAMRPGGSEPLYEIESIDREQARAASLDREAIVWGARPHGYQVGDLAEARVRFTNIHDIVTEWGFNP